LYTYKVNIQANKHPNILSDGVSGCLNSSLLQQSLQQSHHSLVLLTVAVVTDDNP